WRAVRPDPSDSKIFIPLVYNICVRLRFIMLGMGRPAQISREDVLRASMAIADSGGLGAVTMQAVARRLGGTPMALYRHVANKADLLDPLVQGLLTEVPPPPGHPA